VQAPITVRARRSASIDPTQKSRSVALRVVLPLALFVAILGPGGCADPIGWTNGAENYVVTGHTHSGRSPRMRAYFNEAAAALKKHLSERGLTTTSRPPDWNVTTVPKPIELWYRDGKAPVWVLVGQPTVSPGISIEVYWSARGFRGYVDSVGAQYKLVRGDVEKWWADYRATHPNTNLGDPDPSAAFLDRGDAYLTAKEYDKAILEFTEAIRVYAESFRVFHQRGLAYFAKGQCDKAIKDFTEAIDRNPESAPTFYCRGLAYGRLKKYDEGIKDFTEAIRLKPDYADALVNRAEAYFRTKESDKAIADYQQAIQLDPSNVRFLNGLAWHLATATTDRLRDGKKSVELATKACDLSKWKDFEFLDTLAAAYAECGDFKQAIKWQEKAVDLASTDKDDCQKRLDLYRHGKPCRQ
jgi:tetratricopeptide (TPR) repeat protein